LSLVNPGFFKLLAEHDFGNQCIRLQINVTDGYTVLWVSIPNPKKST